MSKTKIYVFYGCPRDRKYFFCIQPMFFLYGVFCKKKNPTQLDYFSTFYKRQSLFIHLVDIEIWSIIEHPSTLAWKIQWTEEPGGLQSKGLLRVGHDFTFTFPFPAWEKDMATHSSVLAWRIPGTGEPDGLPSMGSHRVGHD